jgi:hypothetical protein
MFTDLTESFGFGLIEIITSYFSTSLETVNGSGSASSRKSKVNIKGSEPCSVKQKLAK